MKTFGQDFTIFLNKVRFHQPFALSRWGDGELALLENRAIDLLSKGDGEFRNIPDDPSYDTARKFLNDAFIFRDPSYFIGIACRCCVGDDKHEYMKKLSGQPDSTLTWANVFVNSNYKLFLEQFIPALSGRKTVLVSHEKSDISGLPFKPVKHFKVTPDAWKSTAVTEEIGEWILKDNIRDHVFLFASGPHANIAIYQLFCVGLVAGNTSNTFIDAGSVFDRMLGLRVTRRYLQGGPTINKTCVW